MLTPLDYQLMSQAIIEARKGQYSTSPNPAVGCLITDGNTVACGFHEKAGQGHAEVNALKEANLLGVNLSQATAYVTLEPCSHFGKTPPCCEALSASGIKRVVYAMQDPNPVVSGKGLKHLRDADIQVDGPLLEEEAYALNRGFFHRMKTGLPWFFAKTASSLDGRTAMASGESFWITGPQARAGVQRLRAKSCAIISGIGTVLADDPQLNVRDERFALKTYGIRQPLRVIVDSQCRIPLEAKLVNDGGNTLIAYCKANQNTLQALKEKNIETVQLDNGQGQVDLLALLKFLAGKQCNTVMLEAGSTLFGACLEQQLLNEVNAFVAPTLLGSDAQPLATLPFTKMSQQIRFTPTNIQQIGNDILLTLAPAEPGD
ncbi:MAG: bifunctional diaminohydroxyphosphoribosylaminopyrimidine deaminase/5-amino-6-(5-phosphoribosylamino)uracil reductase RibD [Cellvibrionales bacterium]|nr:bifunctional diaminohydroxyphosphoribosylaminopyrimidine deaminase/5-amino-6-(5-phosphoribosylamino)uracil reductase RibD [Cellvibrionales bacterium]